MSVFDNRESARPAHAHPYQVEGRLFEGVIQVWRVGYGRWYWVKGNRKNSTSATCGACGVDIPAHDQRVYRPFGYAEDRMNRICEKCGDAAKPAVQV